VNILTAPFWTQTYDAKQMTIVPGFIDCHNHAGGNILLYEVIVGNPYEVEFVTIASIIDKLRAKAQKTPAGFWIDGYFFDDTKVKDNRQLNVHDLDQVSKEHPVVVHHRGGLGFRFPVAAWPVAVVLSLDVEDVSRRGGSSEA
jgi:predicted amidohydrolase YtcJ